MTEQPSLNEIPEEERQNVICEGLCALIVSYDETGDEKPEWLKKIEEKYVGYLGEDA